MENVILIADTQQPTIGDIVIHKWGDVYIHYHRALLDKLVDGQEDTLRYYFWEDGSVVKVEERTILFNYLSELLEDPIDLIVRGLFYHDLFPMTRGSEEVYHILLDDITDLEYVSSDMLDVLVDQSIEVLTGKMEYSTLLIIYQSRMRGKEFMTQTEKVTLKGKIFLQLCRTIKENRQ